MQAKFIVFKATNTTVYALKKYVHCNLCLLLAVRAQFALAAVGGAVFDGGFSSFLAVLPLAFSFTYVYFTFFAVSLFPYMGLFKTYN